MMYWYGPEMGTWGYVLMTVGMIAFWVLLIAPEQVLGERFARGEIDEDQYRRRLDTLRGARTGA